MAHSLFAEIEIAGRSVIIHLDDEAAGSSHALHTFLDQVGRIGGNLDAARQEDAIARLADIILPDEIADARGALAADNLALRDRFIATDGSLTSADVAALAGHRSSNRSATANRWKASGSVFSVHHRGTEYYPSFQFRDGRPHPTIGKVIAAMPGRSAWHLALWFVSTNGWLGDAAPADRLDDPDAVVAAARREAEEVIG